LSNSVPSNRDLKTVQRVVIRLDAVAVSSQNQLSVRTILLAAVALAALSGCQSAVESQRLGAEAQSGDLANCAKIRLVSGGCEGNSGFTKVYVDNVHKNRAVRVTVRKQSQEGDDDIDYAIAEGGQLFVGCEGGGTSFVVVGCEVLKGEAERR
jgi:hypothetical protein